MSSTGIIVLVICAVSVVFNALPAYAQGNLMIIPKRVLFDGKKKMQEISLSNLGLDTAIYAISVVNMEMSDSGKQDFAASGDTAEYFADNYLRVYPRQTTLWPNKTQTIKLQLVHSGLLKPGEYRSHLYFRAVPKTTPLGEKAPKGDSVAEGISIVPIKATFGITIPVIIRVGNPDELTVNISSANIKKEGDENWLGITFTREGKISSYGELTVTYISKEGVETQVGYAKGLAIYTPNQKRYFEFRLQKNDGINYKEGSFM